MDRDGSQRRELRSSRLPAAISPAKTCCGRVTLSVSPRNTKLEAPPETSTAANMVEMMR